MSNKQPNQAAAEKTAMAQALEQAQAEQAATQLQQMAAEVSSMIMGEMTEKISGITQEMSDKMAETGKNVAQGIADQVAKFNESLDIRSRTIDETLAAQALKMEAMHKELEELREAQAKGAAPTAPTKPMSKYDKVMARMAQAGDAFLVPVMVCSTIVVGVSVVQTMMAKDATTPPAQS